jgi:hypothetical protein
MFRNFICNIYTPDTIKVSAEAIKHEKMKTQRSGGIAGIAPCIYNHGTRWR